MKKASFLFFNELVAAIGILFLSVLCFPHISLIWFSQKSGVLNAIWIVLGVISLLCALTDIADKKKSVSRRIFQIFMAVFTFAFSWVMGIFMQYNKVLPLILLPAVILTFLTVIISLFPSFTRRKS